MEWLKAIEQRAALVPNHTGAWSDVRKLIAAVKLAEDALALSETAIMNGDDPQLILVHIQVALEQLQSDKFGEGEP